MAFPLHPRTISWMALVAIFASRLLVGPGTPLPPPADPRCAIAIDTVDPPHPAERTVSSADGGAPLSTLPVLPPAHGLALLDQCSNRGAPFPRGQATPPHRYHPIKVRTARPPPG